MSRFIFLLLILVSSTIYSVDFVLFTQPKTGTHLLIPVLREMTGKMEYWPVPFLESGVELSGDFDKFSSNPNYFYFSLSRNPWKREIMNEVWKICRESNRFLHVHAPYSRVMENFLASKKCINFFVLRDPRDQIVSLLNHYRYIEPQRGLYDETQSVEENLMRIIQTELKCSLAPFLGWIRSPLCVTLNFDKLMGTHGGASTDDDAISELRKVAAALQTNPADAFLRKIYRKHFGSGYSFFKGKVGSWRNYFNQEHIALVKSEIGDLLIELGFEKDLNW